MTKNILAIAAGTLCLAGFTACGDGGGGGGGNNPGTGSRFTSTDQVAQVASVASTSLALFGTGGGSTPTSAKTGTGFAKAAPAMAGARSKAAQPNVAQPCGAGGTEDYTPDASTVYGNDGTAVYAKCKETSTNSGTTNSSLVDGRIANKCTDTAQTASVCNASTARFADGPGGATDLVLTQTSTTGSTTNADFSIFVRGDSADSTSGTTDTSTVSATLKLADNVSKHEYSVILDSLKTVSTRTQSGGTLRIDGGFGTNSNTGQCSIGKVTIATNTALVYNSSNITAGKITLTDGAGQAATVEYASDGSARVTLPNGTTRTYTHTELDNFCN